VFFVVRHHTKLLLPSQYAAYAEVPGPGHRRIALKAKPDGSGWEKQDMGKEEVRGHNAKRPYFLIPGCGAVDEHEMADLVAMVRGRAAAGEGVTNHVRSARDGNWWMNELMQHRYEKWARLTGKSTGKVQRG
jgi:hypothetical protein